MQADATNAFEALVLAHLRQLRGQAVILDSDLAWFLGIEPDAITEAVVARQELFPDDFVFRVTPEELAKFENDSPCLTAGGMGSRRTRVAFTTHGVGMLLAAFPEEKFALAAIPVLRAISNYWKAEEAVLSSNRRENRNS